MAEDVPFLLPVVIDATKDAMARVPDRFREVQWLHLPEGGPSAAFVERVRRLLSPEASKAPSALPAPVAVPRGLPISGHRARVWSRAWVVAAAVVAAVAVGYFAFERLAPKRAVPSAVAPVSAPSTVTASFSPPPHSIAVLPFVNMSGDKDQEYFSEGLTEELLNSLSQINDLQVAARTSSFSFKEHPDIGTVARKLNVAAVLEGSVRRSAHTVRVTAQLINAVTGFHLWSKTYDRDLGDVLKLQTEIATAVANALQVTLLGDEAARIELGGTRNPAAFDAYLRGSRAYITGNSEKDVQTAIGAYTEAIRLDPNYALAFAARSIAFSDLGGVWTDTLAAAHESFDRGLADGRKAISLAPELGEGHGALAELFASVLDFTHASEEYQRAVALAPGSASLLENYSLFAVQIGRTDAGLAAARRAVVLDPVNRRSHGKLSIALYYAHRYDEALAAGQGALALDPDYAPVYGWASYYALGNFQSARATCEAKRANWGSQVCLAVIYDKVGRHGDAEAMR